MSILLSLLLGAKLGAMFSVRCMAGTKRRGWGEDSIYFDHASGCRDRQHHRGCPGRWRGSISLGFGPDGRRVRRKVSGQTKTEVKDKLQLLHDELREGVRSSPKYTVQTAVEDWLAQALDGRAAKTISTNREVLELNRPGESGDSVCWLTGLGEAGVLTVVGGLEFGRGNVPAGLE